MAAHNDLGAWGEAYVARCIQDALGGEVHAGIFADLRWRGVEIEVKTARVSNYNGQGARGFQFCIRRRHRKGFLGDVLVLVPTVKGKPLACLVIPADKVGPQQLLTVPLDVEGSRFGAYANQWPLLLTCCPQDSTVLSAD